MHSITMFIVSGLLLAGVILFVSLQKSAEKNLLLLFEHKVDRSLCALCLGNDTLCDTLSFQLDFKRHLILERWSNILYLFLFAMEGVFSFWSTQQRDKNIFFGTLKLNNVIVVSAVAKGPGSYYSELFEQTVGDISVDSLTAISNYSWTLMPFSADIRNLVLCSNDGTESNYLHYNFFNSVVKNNNNSQLWREAWIAAHLSAELLVLKVLNGYRYVPDVYQTCGRVYFVEDCGRTLQYHLNSMSFSNRLLVAKELLTLAVELTDGSAHLNYSFYLTDLTADNIAIKLNKTTNMFLSLNVIDWSDVIVVANNHSLTVNSLHVSEHIDCGIGCLTYSEEDICQASFSDHNIYTVCKEFLSDESGLLHGMTELKTGNKQFKIRTRLLQFLVKECLWHADMNNSRTNRFKIAKSITSVLQQMFEMI